MPLSIAAAPVVLGDELYVRCLQERRCRILCQGAEDTLYRARSGLLKMNANPSTMIAGILQCSSRPASVAVELSRLRATTTRQDPFEAHDLAQSMSGELEKQVIKRGVLIDSSSSATANWRNCASACRCLCRVHRIVAAPRNRAAVGPGRQGCQVHAPWRAENAESAGAAACPVR